METKPASEKGAEVKKAICWASPGCHDQCSILVQVDEEGRITKIRGNRELGNGRFFRGCPDRLPYLIRWLYHPEQLMYPLKRVGSRGENKRERISWDQALDEIAEKLREIKARYGPESLALTEGTYRSDMYGIRSRFLHLFGNPGNIGCPGTICGCNRRALYRALLGTTALKDNFDTAKCIVIGGGRTAESGRRRWLAIKERLREGGVKLIVIDPRRTEEARHADIWLQIRPGTDCALFLAWINVIIEERLYDADFVDKWTFGFDELRRRVAEYTPERVAEITWVPPDKIRAAARMYATNRPGHFARGVAADHIGLNAIRVEEAKVCLRAITGNLRVNGGETPLGPGPIVNGRMAIRDGFLQLEDKCPPEQRRKQIGSDRFKLMTWPAYEIINRLYRERYGIPLTVSGHDFLSPQPLIWRAILTGQPYPIKAMITWGSNPLLNAANTKLVYQALKSPNLELHVVLEHFLTPTALLADYVLPIASKLEKPTCSTYEDFAPTLECGERPVQPLGERRSDYDFFRGLAIRLGFGEYFPWASEEELANYRLEPLGLTLEEAAAARVIASTELWTYETVNPRTGEPTGFATPSGKVELYSKVLEELGYDPLPFYEEPPESPLRTPEIAREYPLILTTGGRIRPLFHSEHRQLGIGMREQHPEPMVEIHPETARELGISDGDWVCVETRRGAIRQRARLTLDIHPRVVNVESHWWFPEQPPEDPGLCGVWEANANVLTLDEPDACDPLTGGWALRALLCKVYKPRLSE
ncbi:MAG: molybdopterin-dependent oxidoreductase [Clostridia bacterium]|jgi:anaerobic selenocysteine-containing dehydrogenase|nr:molybdopterin-dependent oxidoreductase [Clostridia bacterium]MDH7574064.1 molybdopterin-dependent oxidoreductase [Clostridia bacterium]